MNGLRGRTNGRVNGLTNGVRGRTNGLTDGLTNGIRGRTNGLTNGRGRTSGVGNGIGYVNGVQLRRNISGAVRPSDVRVVAYLATASILAMIVLGYLLGVPAPTPSQFQADGDFSEWASVPQYTDEEADAPASADLVSFATHWEPGRLAVYGRARGPLFAGADPTSVYVLIDDPSRSGYRVTGFDADFIAEVWGSQGAVQDSSFREWMGDPDSDNATAFWSRGAFAAAGTGTQLEFTLPDSFLDLEPARGLRFLLATRTADALDIGIIVGLSPGALVVDQRALADVVTAPAPVLELRLRAQVADVEVRDLAVVHSGGGSLVLPTFPLLISAGQARVVWISLDPTGLAPGAFVRFHLAGADAVSADTGAPVPATVRGSGARAYAQALPATKAVDGLFSDWMSVIGDGDDIVPASVDIRESAIALEGDAFFYVATEGEILAGAILPERRFLPPPPSTNGSSSTPLPLRREAAEDVLRIFVDTDDGDVAGFLIGGILADRMFEVKGRAGRITSQANYFWNGTARDWDRGTGALDVAFVGTQLEARAPSAVLGTLSNPRVVFAMTDWSRVGDLTDPLRWAPAPTKTAIPVGPMHAVGNESVLAPPLLNTPTVDASCDSFNGEYAGAGSGGNTDLQFLIGTRADIQFVFVCIEVIADSTNRPGDMGSIVFDTLHDGGPQPLADDRRFQVWNGGNPFWSWRGDGDNWLDCSGVCDPGNLADGNFRGSRMWYEFRIRYTDVWGTLTPSDNATAGFAIYIVDEGNSTSYWWGSSNVIDDVPDSWGHVQIPEFPLPALAAGVALLVPISWWRRRESPRKRGR